VLNLEGLVNLFYSDFGCIYTAGYGNELVKFNELNNARIPGLTQKPITRRSIRRPPLHANIKQRHPYHVHWLSNYDKMDTIPCEDTPPQQRIRL